MNLLVLCDHLLKPDRSAGDFRLFQLLAVLAGENRLDFCIPRPDLEQFQYAPSERKRYTAGLAAAGINLPTTAFPALLRDAHYDIIWFEFHHTASEESVRHCRFAQPQAILIVDSVDIQFSRLAAKSRLTGSREDAAAAEAMRGREMDAYERSDVVLTVSEDDRARITRENENLRVEVIPLIYPIPEKSRDASAGGNRLLFIGVFSHEPNLDAMIYFCRDVFPLIRAAVPDATLTVVGSNPPPELVALAGDGIEVTGFVQSTEPYLLAHSVSVAPLRFGSGMKGKIGEAMSYGLPVVTTSFGIEGFGLTPDKHVLLGDSADAFADCVIRLLRDPALAAQVGESGRSFLRSNYSREAIETQVLQMVDTIRNIPPKPLAAHRRASMLVGRLYREHIAWRFGDKSA